MSVLTVARSHMPRALRKVYDFVDALAASKKYAIPVQISSTDLLAGTAQQVVVPYAGFLEVYKGIIQAAVTTGGAVKLQLNGVDVTGATFTIADADAAGIRYNPTFTRVAVAAGDEVTVVPAAAIATAGAANVVLGFTAN